jgi:hypothetical protein
MPEGHFSSGEIAGAVVRIRACSVCVDRVHETQRDIATDGFIDRPQRGVDRGS